MIFLSTLLTSVLITTATIPLICRLAHRYQLVDIPDGRKVHIRPIPRLGGVAIALGIFAPLLYWLAGERIVSAYILGGLVLVLFGLLDDLLDLSPLKKLAGQLIASLTAIFIGGVKIVSLGALLPDGMILPDGIAVPLTVLAIVGVTNAINLSDGLDGLAGGVSLMSIATIGTLAYLNGNLLLGFIAVAVCGAVFGFLRYNTFPATIFMGDTGSQLLGFSAIYLSLALTQGSTPLSPLLPLIILGFPVLDTVSVMIGRIVNHRSPFSPDKSHFHHSLIRLGFEQSESVLVIYMIQAALILSAWQFRYHTDWVLLGGYMLFSAAVIIVFARSQRAGWKLKELSTLKRSKAYLRWFRDQTSYIRFLFRPLVFGLPLLIAISAALCRNVPAGIAFGALLPALLLIPGVCRYRNKLPELLRFVVYLLIPVVIYYSDRMLNESAAPAWRNVYNVSFALLALLNIAVSKLTKRKEGFKSTPLDFLILLIVVAMPLIPVSNLEDYHLGMIAGKILILFFSCEVLFAELRGEVTLVARGIAVACLLLGVNGLFKIW